MGIDDCQIIRDIVGKTSQFEIVPESEIEAPYLCLLHHMIDVAAVAIKMWELGLSQEQKKNLATLFTPPHEQYSSSAVETDSDGGINEKKNKLRFAYLAGLHDIGKASPFFQEKVGNRQKLEENLGWPETTAPGLPFEHGELGAVIIQEYLAKQDWPKSLDLSLIAQAIAGHHGTFIRTGRMRAMRNKCTKTINTGGDEWDRIRTSICDLLKGVVGVDEPKSISTTPSNMVCLAGFTTLVDWIASDSNWFEFPTEDNWDQRFENSKEIAERMIRDNFLTVPNKQEGRSFNQNFPNISTPRPLQELVDEECFKSARMVIIEAPTGEGKTEAALQIVDNWVNLDGARGCFFALPTMATSNQMMGRVVDFLTNRRQGEDDFTNLMLLHGHAHLSSQMKRLSEGVREVAPNSISLGGTEGESSEPNIVAGRWFMQSKRGLLSPWAVGTVDQTLLSTLNVRHFFLRLFALSGTTIVFDEVHAYSVYMNELFKRLLNWLGVMNTKVIVLSATLPNNTRSGLIEAYQKGLIDGKESGTELKSGESQYPLVSLVDSHSQIVTKTIESSQKERRVRWNLVKYSGNVEETLIDTVTNFLSDGEGGWLDTGCIAIICNTVSRAQSVFSTLRGCLQDAEQNCDNLLLFHSRFPFGVRDRIEKNVLGKFGKEGERPRGAILVATQVVEQSLDLDFDVMVSELAPIDLLIQRCGRIHRHSENDRPSRFESPDFHIIMPKIDEKGEGIPKFPKGWSYVYEEEILQRTAKILCDRLSETETFELCGKDARKLVEAVYGLSIGSSREMLGENRAHLNLIDNPFNPSLITLRDLTSGPPLQEDAQLNNWQYKALTRLSGPTLQFVVIDKEDGIPRWAKALPNTTPEWRKLFNRVITISRRDFVEHILNNCLDDCDIFPPAWKSNVKTSQLGVIVCDGGVWRCNDFKIIINRQMGVGIRRVGDDGRGKGG